MSADQATGTTSAPPEPVIRRHRRWGTLVVGLALSVTLPILAFQGVDLSQSWELIQSCLVPELALAGFLFLATLWFRSWRWRYLLVGWSRVRAESCFSATCVGYLANNVLPFRLGDLVRVGTLGKLEGISAARILGTIAVERILDILTLVVFLGVYLAVAAAGPHQQQLVIAGQLALGGALAIALLLVAGYWRRQAVQRFVATPFGWVSPKLGHKMQALAGKFLEGLQTFASVRQVLQVVVLSATMWGASVFSYYYVGRAIGLEIALADFVVVVFAAAFGAIIPAAPGGVGTFHGFARLGLYLVAVHSGEVALAFAAVLHALEWLLINVAGLYFLARDRLRLLAAPIGENDAPPRVARAEPQQARYPQPV